MGECQVLPWTPCGDWLKSILEDRKRNCGTWFRWRGVADAGSAYARRTL